MALIGLIISAGVMASISAYMLFKVKENNESNDNNMMSAGLQVLFFFMVLSSFVLMGSAAFESRNDCEYLLTNVTTVNSNLTQNSYSYECTERITGAASWIYRLPVWLSLASALYLVVYLLQLIVSVIKFFNKGGERG